MTESDHKGMAIQEDSSTPAVTHPGTGASATTASFTPPDASLVVVCVNVGNGPSPTGGATLSAADSGSVSYTAGPQVEYAVGYDISGIFYHYYTTSPGSITVTVTSTATDSPQQLQIAARVLTGAAAKHPAGVTNTGSVANSQTGSVTTTIAGSWVYVAAGGYPNGNAASTAAANTTLIDSWYQNTYTGCVVNTGRQTSATSTPGATTLGFILAAGDNGNWGWTGQEILPALSVTTSSLPGGTQEIAYSQTVSAAGGSGSYTWSVSAGSLPSGLTLGSSTGLISGTPTGSGLSDFTVKATDSVSNPATRALSINIAAAGSGMTGFVVQPATMAGDVTDETTSIAGDVTTAPSLPGQITG